MASKKTKVKMAPATGVDVADEIKIPALNIQRMKVKVRGLSPVIMHAWDPKAGRQILDKQMGAAKLKKQPKDPHADFMAARYIIEGVDCIPANSFKKSIVTAGTFTDMFKTHLNMCLFIRGNKGNGQYVEIKGTEPTMRQDMVRIGGASKTADVRFRPEYTEWEAEFVVEFNATMLTAAQVFNLINIAGFSCGVGEWRPQKGGEYGRFELAMEADEKAA
jgi:hypothetical protein